jgi:fumarate reductase subunit C
MKVYLALTAVLFAVLTVVHVWRAFVEPSTRNPWFIAITIVSAILCLWAARLWRRHGSAPTNQSP